jgi:CheY-like chemotaxis protein
VPRAKVDQVQTVGDNGEGTEKRAVRFEANSNLEQISDWLTKILVGAGLVQLAALPGFLKSVGDYLGASLGIPAASPVSVAVVLYGFGVGFLFSYLWARLRLRVLLETSERQAVEATREVIARQLTTASRRPDAQDSRAEIERVARNTERLSRTVEAFDSVLWVDDYPENNKSLIAAMQELGIEVQLSHSTADALEKLKTGNFGLIITDLGRREDGREVRMAGLELVQAVAQLPDHPPIFVYAGQRGLREANKLREAGADFVTASPSAIFERTVKLLGHST